MDRGALKKISNKSIVRHEWSGFDWLRITKERSTISKVIKIPREFNRFEVRRRRKQRYPGIEKVLRSSNSKTQNKFPTTSHELKDFECTCSYGGSVKVETRKILMKNVN